MNKEREQPPSGLTLEIVAQRVSESTLEHGGHQPTLMIEDTENQLAILQFGNLPDTFAEREQQMFATGFALAQSGSIGTLKQMFFVTEGWMSLMTGDKAPERRPSQDPDRQEVLLITQMDVHHRQQGLAIFEMIRDAAYELQALNRYSFEGAVGEERMDSPLLDAFVWGYGAGLSSRTATPPNPTA